MGELNHPDFKPFPFFVGSHSQTVAGSFLTFSRNPKSITRLVHLPDGEKITLEVSTPSGWKSTGPTVVMVHGLCGSHLSPYLIRIAKKLCSRNVRSIRLNLRGCGSGKGHAKRMYHDGMSDDVWKALEEIKKDAPKSSLTLLGISLGGNVVLKMAGERGEEAKQLIDKVIGINPPIDLQASNKRLSKNRVYERYFMSDLRSDVLFIHQHFEDLPPIEIPHAMSLKEFDEFYIAPQAGFASASEYYYACSSGRLLPEIRVPCHILFAKDDPIVDCNVLGEIKTPENVKIHVTEHGGHLGYLGFPGREGGFYWMDSMILQWIYEP